MTSPKTRRENVSTLLFLCFWTKRRQIAKQLTLDRTPTPRNGGGQWSWSAVDRILHEEAYIGT
ncbi:MAG: hypothetical protein DMG10_27615, partial [Acidobacteria bacterium]